MNQQQLAIRGGNPAMTHAPPAWPVADAEITEAVNQALADGTWGKYDSCWTENLIQIIRQQFDVEHVLLCCSGTIAVELALRGLGIKPEHEVILAGYDFPGNFRAIEAVGANPVLVDVVEQGWVISPASIGPATNDSTKAIIVSHMHGQIADMPRIREICDSNNLQLIEDVCQMPGGSIDGKPLGAFGDVAAISFGGSKLLSAGRGGALLTNSADLFQRAKIYNSRGNEAFPLSQLQAAVLSPQLGRLDERNTTRHQNALRLIDATQHTKTLTPLKQVAHSNDRKPAYYKLPWLLNAKDPTWNRDQIIAAFQAEGVPIDVGFRGFTRRSLRRCRHADSLVNATIAASQTILLHHPILLEPDETISRLASAINKVANFQCD